MATNTEYQKDFRERMKKVFYEANPQLAPKGFEETEIEKAWKKQYEMLGQTAPDNFKKR